MYIFTADFVLIDFMNLLYFYGDFHVVDILESLKNRGVLTSSIQKEEEEKKIRRETDNKFLRLFRSIKCTSGQ